MLSAKVEQIIAVAFARVTQCPYCINGHTKAALRVGATPEELMEAIWVTAEMRAGGAYAQSTLCSRPWPKKKRSERIGPRRRSGILPRVIIPSVPGDFLS